MFTEKKSPYFKIKKIKENIVGVPCWIIMKMKMSLDRLDTLDPHVNSKIVHHWFKIP